MGRIFLTQRIFSPILPETITNIERKNGMKIKSDESVGFRLPTLEKQKLEFLSERLGLSMSFVLKKFCEDGFNRFNITNPINPKQYLLEIGGSR
jgi:hypothetical protein